MIQRIQRIGKSQCAVSHSSRLLTILPPTDTSTHYRAYNIDRSIRHDFQPNRTWYEPRPDHLSGWQRLFPRNIDIRVLSRCTNTSFSRFGELESHWSCFESTISVEYAYDRSWWWCLGSEFALSSGEVVSGRLCCLEIRPATCKSSLI